MARWLRTLILQCREQNSCVGTAAPGCPGEQSSPVFPGFIHGKRDCVSADLQRACGATRRQTTGAAVSTWLARCSRARRDLIQLLGAVHTVYYDVADDRLVLSHRSLHPSPLVEGRLWRAMVSGRQFGILPTILWEFLRESTPAQKRQRYGDADYDWDHRVNTTSATVSWRDRLLGEFHSAYQPTEPALFREMMESMSSLEIEFQDFTFIDVGSGKGRVLLMAADYPFRRILGIELLADLHRVAQANIQAYKAESQRCFDVESAAADARGFAFPARADRFFTCSIRCRKLP